MTRGAGDIDRALAAGVPRDVVGVLAAARRHWWTSNEHPLPLPTDPTYWPGVDEALAHPLAAEFDEVFVAALRRQRGLTCRTAVVRSGS